MFYTTRIHKLLYLALAGLIALGSPLPASAGAFNVKPIKVFLSKENGSTVLTIENQASNVLRLQVRAYAWKNDKHGQPVLSPTDDVIVFPTLVNVMPMEHRSIRIGFSGQPAGKELTYRLALDELPSLESQLSRTKQPGLEVRTRITVPVFFTPDAIDPKGQLGDVGIKRGIVQANFSNLGNVHATVSTAEVIGRNASGTKLFDKQINGWYVLAGESWSFQTDLGRYCSKLKSVSVTVQSDFGTFSRNADASSGACR